jgi:hypothetical protein
LVLSFTGWNEMRRAPLGTVPTLSRKAEERVWERRRF